VDVPDCENELYFPSNVGHTSFQVMVLSER
jgi:hypothetical protein